MIVTGIDPSLVSAGVAVIRADSVVAWGKPGAIRHEFDVNVRSIGKNGARTDTYAMRSARIVRQAIDVCALVPADSDLVVLEGPAYSRNLPSSFDRSGLWWGIYSAIRARKIPIAVCMPNTRANYPTGKGNADKDMVLAAMRLLWPNVTIRNHDQADALVLATIGAQKLGAALPFEIKPRHTAALKAVAWPKELTNA